MNKKQIGMEMKYVFLENSDYLQDSNGKTNKNASDMEEDVIRYRIRWD